MKKFRLLASVYSLLAILFSSCNHKELCYEHPHIKNLTVAFEWEKAPEANPDGMCVWFYPLDNTDINQVQRLDFSGKSGGKANLLAGRYHAVAFNNDSEVVQLGNSTDFSTHHGFTREGSLFEPIYGSGANIAPPRGDNDERVTISPDMLWGDSGMFIEVTGDDQVITFYPEELVCIYTVEIRNVKNLSHTTQMCGSLSSMAPHVIFSDKSVGRECVTVPFACNGDGASTINGRFMTFGHHEENEEPHTLTLYVWMDDGSKWYYTFNVTQQVHKAPNPRRVNIIIDNLDLPQPITNGSGFHPDIDDWFAETEDVEM